MTSQTAPNHTASDGYDAIVAARSVLPVLRDTSANSDLQRQVDDRAISVMRDAGLARLLTPKEYGGLELPPSAQIRTCMIMAGACSAASWVHMVCGAHTFVVARFPKECRDEVFSANPDVLLPGTLAPQGTVTRADNGWRLSGRWQFGSGVDHGPWLLLGALGEKLNGGGRLPPVHVVVPTSDVEIDDTWYTLGMRGTGSKDLVARDVFVPDHRAMETVPLFSGTFEEKLSPLYHLPVMGGLAAMLAGTAVGFSEAGLANFVDATKVRRDAYAGNAKAAKAGIQMRVAEAESELKAARHFVEQNCELLDEAMAAHRPPVDLETRVQIRWNAAYAVELCRRATERIFAVSGAHAIYDDHPLQKMHRDINTASHHAIVDFDGVAEIKGRLELGLTDGIGLV
ncbi:MAG TPA: hypothetical protein EYQ81_17230 [Sneathiellales bacterium]|nr:hypothetical protein [Sneathiellales bacterium]